MSKRELAGVAMAMDRNAYAAYAAGAPAAALSRSAAYRVSGAAAVIPIVGILSKYSPADPTKSLGSSYTQIEQNLQQALADPAIERIVLFCDSPGGEAGGVANLAAAIFGARAAKPIIAYVPDRCCSAAYWLACQAGAVVASESAFIGSIGIFRLLIDSSAAAAAEGLSFKLVAAGEYKGAGAEGLPIDDKAVSEAQREVDSLYDLFVDFVAAGRNLSRDQVTPLSDGRLHVAAEALALGLIDGVGSFEAAIDFPTSALPITGQRTMLPKALADAGATNPKPQEQQASPPLDPMKAVTDALATLTAQVKSLCEQIGKTPKADDDAGGNDGDADAKAKAAAAKASAEAADRLKAIHASCPGRADFAMNQFLAGKSAIEAKAALADVLLEEIKTQKPARPQRGAEPLALGDPDPRQLQSGASLTPEQRWEADEKLRARYSGNKEYFLAALHTGKHGFVLSSGDDDGAQA